MLCYILEKEATAMKLRWLFIAALMILPAVLAAPDAHAASGNFAIQGDWGDDEDFGIGARVFFDVGGRHDGWGGLASFDYFFPGDDFRYWELNGNLTYALGGDLQPYVGGGLNLAHLGLRGAGSDTNVGLNLLGGIRVSRRVFAEGRVELGGGKQFVLTVGVLL
jgi:hypothetical protein